MTLAPALATTFAKGLLLGALLPGAPGGSQAPEPLALQGVDVMERLGQRVPAQTAFTDSTGARVRLGDLLDGRRPVVLTMGYYDCPALCSLVLRGQVAALKHTGLSLGPDYRTITVSIDPEETATLAAERKHGYLQSMDRLDAAADWSFLVGDDADIAMLAEAVGFGFRKDPTSGEYAHAAVVVVLTPDGRVSRYLYGIDFNPRDLRLAMIEASGGKVGTSFDRFLLTCFRWNPARRKYALFLDRYYRTGGVLLLLGVGSMLAVLWRRELKGRRGMDDERAAGTRTGERGDGSRRSPDGEG